MTEVTEALKPCPFCGGAARRSMYGNSMVIGYAVGCSDCILMTEWTTETKAIAAWNCRITAPAPDVVERAILEICQDVCELPDRTSPEDEPDQVIVTLDELSDICRSVLTEALSAIPIPAPRVEVERALREALVKIARARDGTNGECYSECQGIARTALIDAEFARQALTDHTTKGAE